MFACSPEENFLVSIGCGDMRMVSMGDSVIGRLIETVMYKTYPAKEEEIRALWGDYSESYTRLDPKLDIDDIRLDDVKLMISLLSKVRTIIREDHVLQQKISVCAWKLLANTFFCRMPGDVWESETCGRSLLLCCRLGDDIQMILQRWPKLGLLVNGSTYHTNLTKFPCAIEIGDVSLTTKIDVELVYGTRKASINGFPMALESLLYRRSIAIPSTMGLGKRKFPYDDV